jgi:hypothetical protein
MPLLLGRLVLQHKLLLMLRQPLLFLAAVAALEVLLQVVAAL